MTPHPLDEPVSGALQLHPIDWVTLGSRIVQGLSGWAPIGHRGRADPPLLGAPHPREGCSLPRRQARIPDSHPGKLSGLLGQPSIRLWNQVCSQKAPTPSAYGSAFGSLSTALNRERIDSPSNVRRGVGNRDVRSRNRVRNDPFAPDEHERVSKKTRAKCDSSGAWRTSAAPVKTGPVAAAR